MANEEAASPGANRHQSLCPAPERRGKIVRTTGGKHDGGELKGTKEEGRKKGTKERGRKEGKKGGTRGVLQQFTQ